MALPLLGLIPLVTPLFEKVIDLFPDGDAKEKAKAEFSKSLLETVAKEGEDSREINKVEAAHSSIFVAGWRPFIGWVSGVALGFQFIIRPFWVWVGSIYFPTAPIPPSLDESLWELMFGMLGIGGLRTIEKIKGKAR